MGCGCADRQRLLAGATRAAVQGNVAGAGRRLATAAQSMADDAQRLARIARERLAAQARARPQVRR